MAAQGWMRSSKSLRYLIGVFAIWVLGLCAALPTSANPADWLLLNGRIVTLDDASSVNEALTIEAGRVSATGSSAELRKLAGAANLADALERLRTAAASANPDGWLIVAGGWTPRQLTENRRPTEAGIAGGASRHPVSIQLFYGYVLLNAAGRARLGITSEQDLPEGTKFERDGEKKPTGWIVGGGRA